MMTTEQFTLYWVREDGQGNFNMGAYQTRHEAEAAIEGALAELIDQCGEDYQVDQIRADRFTIEARGEG